MGNAKSGRIPLAKIGKTDKTFGISRKPRFEPLQHCLCFFRHPGILAQSGVFRKHPRAKILSRQRKRFRRQPIDPGQQAVQRLRRAILPQLPRNKFKNRGNAVSELGEQPAIQRSMHPGYKINPMRRQKIHRRKTDAIGVLMMIPEIALDKICALRPFRAPGFPIKSPLSREDAFRANTVFFPQKPLKFFFHQKQTTPFPPATFPPDPAPSSRSGRWIPP